MRIYYMHPQGEWYVESNNTIAERTVLWWAGFPLDAGKKYRKVDFSAYYNREALNWIGKIWRTNIKPRWHIWVFVGFMILIVLLIIA